jgi:hypothetical protein
VDKESVIERVRELCLSLPGANERLSHGAPTFFIQNKKSFVMVQDNHHGDGKFALWSAAPPGMQTLLKEADPELYFIPPYVGHHGWIGLRLDRGAAWDTVAGVIEDAYLARAPKKLAAEAVKSGTYARKER